MEYLLLWITPRKNLEYTPEALKLLGAHPATIEEMQSIVAHYIAEDTVTGDVVAVCGINTPFDLDADPFDVDEPFQERVSNLFWAETPILAYAKTSPIDDIAIFDIDGDGTDEQCAIFPGHWSSGVTFVLIVCENGGLEYFNEFEIPSFLYLSFEKNSKGKTALLGKAPDNTTDKPSDRQHRMELGVSDGNIVIYNDGQTFPYYGEQGIHSPYAPK